MKKACVSSSAIPSWWSTQPSRVTLMLKVKSPMRRVQAIRSWRWNGRPSQNVTLRMCTRSEGVASARGRICGGSGAVAIGGSAVSAAPASRYLARAMTMRTWLGRR
ncbi:hypothetical protein BE17_48625 [Sorangium cellulosum]|uniref:Uncharacterized protein n=1 Tax=Sorangium cellulosum TaxID=56 RepID=A0A150SL75_SORCE|nr:hypothetical protein BE17_48625 [Sorangium cellulosum]